MPSRQPSKAIGIFETQESVVAAVKALLAAGFQSSQIVVVARDWHGDKLVGPRVDLQQSAESGAVKGAAFGTGVGLAAAVVASMIPGVGVGLLVLGALAGATGAAVGSFVGPFVALEINEADAKEHAEHIEAGRIIVVVSTIDRSDEAQTLMVAHNAYDLSMTNEQ